MRKTLTLIIHTLLIAMPFQGHAISDLKFLDLLRGERRIDAYTVKTTVARFDEKKSLHKQGRNGDEFLYGNLRGSFGKGLQHFSSGFVNPEAFRSLVYALEKGKPDAFNEILIGDGIFRLVNPQASLAYSLSANDGWINIMPPAPRFTSSETAGEMVELYWTALVRDIPFSKYADGTSIPSTGLTMEATFEEMSDLSDFRGPKDMSGDVTTGNFLRGNTPGDLRGPYISQFLYLPIPLGQLILTQKLAVPKPAPDNTFNTTFTDWFAVINGGTPNGTPMPDPTPRFIITARDLAEYVHTDAPGQSTFLAALLINSWGPDALDRNNPYLTNPTQDGFVSYGICQILQLVENAIEEGLKAAWYQKWQVHRRLRPEEYGFYVQQQIVEGIPLGISSELTSSTAAQTVHDTYPAMTYFLPQAYPEGSPVHPSYPAGHATLMGAAVTVLKAFFNEEFVIPDTVIPNADGSALEDYFGDTLTLGNELNKLAANISLGRDHAGVHYRSDGFDGMNLGEIIAIDILNNSAFLFNENFEGFTLTKFDGTTITVGARKKAL